MIARLRWPLLLATLIGLAAAIWTLGRAGWTPVLASAGRVGIPGFATLCLISAATFLLLGGSWLAAARGVPARLLPRFAWGRATREAANDLLPFSQIGGILVGIRTVTAAGASEIPVYAATVVDMSTELAAQLVFTLYALWAFGTALTGAETTQPVLWLGLGVATALTLAFFLLQRPAIRFAGLLLGRVLPDARAMAASISAELAAVYAVRSRVALSFALNLAAWLTTAWWSWLALRLMGAPSDLWRVAALESAIFAVRSAAFLIPGALGAQEAAYALLAPVIGIDPAAALALSLLKRARDLGLGLPTLLIWQGGELRRALRGRASRGRARPDIAPASGNAP